MRHEIIKAWNDGKGVLGIRVDKLLDSNSRSSTPGANPFDAISFGNTGRKLSSIVQLVTPVGLDSKATYAAIANGIEGWIEDAIAIRARN